MPTDPGDLERGETEVLGVRATPDAPAGGAPGLPPATVLGHFVVDHVLGRGGMGVVYAASDTVLARQVAIKVLRRDLASDPSEAQSRLLREARAASRVVHPNVVTVYEAGFIDDQVFIAMELVEGGSLASWLAARPRTWKEIVPIFVSAGHGLAAVHEAGLVHRDFKPANVLLGRDGRVRVSDFGIVGVSGVPSEPGRAPLASEPAAGMTLPGVLVGTPRYMAPEQHLGSRVDARADQFSFAVSLFEALAGEAPFAGATLDELRRGHLAGAMRPLPDGVPGWLARIVRRALDTDPQRRFPSMTALVHALERGLVSSARGRLRRWSPWLGIGAAAAAGLATAVVVAGRGPGPVVTVTDARRVTVDPGCEEYPRFLPGGRSVVYDGLVDGDYELIRLDLDGGARLQLTHDRGWDYGASVSPDGRLAAYVHQGEARELRVVATDGTGTPRTVGLIAVGYPSWTGDGAILVGDSEARIRRIGLDGATTYLPVSLPPGARLQHLLSVGDHGVAAVFLRSNDIPTMSLAEVRRDGGHRIVETALIDEEAGLARAPSTDAYYATAGGAAGSAQIVRRRWGGAAVAVPGALSAHAGLDVSADGKRLVFSTCAGKNHLVVMPGKGPARPLPRGEWGDVYPRRVDDHHFLATSGRGGQQQVWLLDEAGAGRALTAKQTSSGAATWQGDRLAYVDSAGGGLFTVAIAGDDAPRRLTSDVTDTSPSFSRDGRHVVFERSAPGEPARVWWVPIEGGAPEPLGPPGTYHPAASPTDDMIVAVDLTGRGPAVVALEGGRARSLGLAGTRPRFSPDGRRLIVIQDEVRVVEWTRDGSAPLRTVWQATTEAVFAADYLDDEQVVASVSEYAGDLWLADGAFP